MRPSAVSVSDAPQRVFVPFVDLAPASATVKNRVLDRIAEIIDRGDFANGAAVAEFERQFARYCGLAHCVALASGLDALRLSLMATGLSEGGGVAVPAMTFAATFEAVIQAGGNPVVVDISANDYTMDMDALESVVGSVTHVLPVDLYGQLVDLRRLARIAAEHELKVIEDACQAHGARRDGIRGGATASAAAFSFYPTKNLGAMGDAGAVITDDPDLAAHVRALREHGETRKYHHEHVGYTARLDTIQAAILLEKLQLLDGWNDQRRCAAAFYNEALRGVGNLSLPPVAYGSEPAWHLYVMRTPERERLERFLAGRDIRTGRHYPEPPHLAPAYRRLGLAEGDFPVAEALARDGLSLPMFPGITEVQLAWVCRSVADYFDGATA
jgi:dTDP-4-amino-4,6-dideoxygalactose transaminase